MTIGEKLQFIVGKKLYVIAGTLFTCFLLACLIYLAVTPSHAVVFLRTTFPSNTSALSEDVAGLEESETAVLVRDVTDIVTEETEDTEQRLVAMLMQDDAQVVYDKMENKERWQVVHMRVTGYCSCAKCCGRFSDGRTANSHRIKWGDRFVAADKNFRFGTEMIIPGYNHAQPVKVLDRGKAIKGNRLDLYFNTHRQAQKWGVKYMDVLVKTSE